MPNKIRQILHQTVIILGLVILCFSNTLHAQRPTSTDRSFPNSGTAGNSERQGSNSTYQETRDTFGVFYFYADQPNVIKPLDDTTLNLFDQYNPIRKPLVDYADLGNLGSSHRPIFYETPFRQGFDVGYHQFDQYYIQPEQVQFNVLKTPFSRVFFSQGATQSDGYFKGQFSRNFSDGLNLSFQAKTIRQLGEDRQYPNQKVQDEAVGTGVWWNAPSGKYDGFLYFTSNSTEQEENGGLIAPPIEGGDAVLGGSSAKTADVFLPSGTRTRHAHKTLGYQHYLKLVKQDAAQNSSREFTAAHKIQYQTHIFKFSDELNPSDTSGRRSYYGDFYTDQRGLRNYIRWQVVENRFQLSTFRPSKKQNSKEVKENDRLEIGLTHKLNLLRQDNRDSVINNLFVTGRLDFRLKDRVQINTYAHFGILANAGDYRLSGNAFFDIGKLGTLSASFVNQAYEPYLIQQEFYVSQRPIWQQDLKKTISTSLTGTYELPLIGLSVTGGYHLLNNHIYYDTAAMPVQADQAVNILQLAVQQQLRLWKFYFHNQIAFQATTQDFYRTPNWLSQHRLYFETALFKNALSFQLGAELRMNAPYFADTYQPLLGQFHLQDEEEVNFYPALNAFLNVKVKTVRIFVKAENLTDLLTENLFYYQTAKYAQPLYFLRFGLDWRLIN